MKNKISIFGSSSFIGSNYINLYSDSTIPILSNDFQPQSNTILYFRSTTSNYIDLKTHIEVNLVNLEKILKNIPPNSKFIFISSWFVYGQSNYYKLINENDNYKTLGYYNSTKLCAEQIVETYCRLNNIDFLILRLSNIIGNGDKPSAQKNALQFLINELRLNNTISLYNNGDFYRSYLHVEECCRAINHCINLDKNWWNQIINIGPEETTWKFKDIIKYCADKLNSKSTILNREPSDLHKICQVESFRMDTSKLKSTKFKWKLTLKESLDKILQ